MRAAVARTTWLLLALNFVLAGLCPMVPAMPLARVHKQQCQHEQHPSGDRHSCCVTAHHQPALVRTNLESSSSFNVPAFVPRVLTHTAHGCEITAITLAPSPPLASVLRI